MVKIGIPRGLYYYKYYPLWKTFFEELGVKVVVSEPTNKKILNRGINNCVAEACLPIKAYFGHVISLVGKVDYIFIPRFTSVSPKQYICPEVCGLPDMIKNSFGILPRIIDTEINLRESSKNSWKAALEVGSFITKDKSRIKKAYTKALENYRRERMLVKNGILPDENGGCVKKSLYNLKPTLEVAVIGHHYTVYDDFLNMELLKRLKSFGVEVITLDMLDYTLSQKNCRELCKPLFWDYGTRAYGGIIQLLALQNIDGIIAVTSYGCGVDSFIDELVEQKVRHSEDIPFMKLVLDEHSADAGMSTRIEAFVDMISRRRVYEADVSSYR